MALGPTSPILNNLLLWAKDPTTQIECSSREGRDVTVFPIKENFSFWRLLGKIFVILNKDLHKYRGLKNVIKNIVKNYTPDQKEDLEKIFGKIRHEFLSLHWKADIASKIQAVDLLEAYNEIFSPQSNAKNLVERISGSDIAPIKSEVFSVDKIGRNAVEKNAEVSSQRVLLVEYGKITEFVKALESSHKAGIPLTREEVLKLMSEQLLKTTHIPMGKMIDLLYHHKFKGRVALESLITRIAIWQFGSLKKVKDVQKTVKFFNKLHIDLWLDIGGKLFSFSEVFGYNIREAKSLQESFTRPITKDSKDRLLAPFITFREEVRKKVRDAQVICSNAFAQNTILDCPSGAVDTPRSIRGKVLSPSLQIKEEIGYEGASPFTIHDLFGGYGLSDSPENKAEAQKALLGAMTSFINAHDTTLVVQRLAPSDIHHFYSTADAQVLTREECCKILSEEFQNDPEKKRQIEGLLKSFEGDEGSTINIQGSTLSPVTTAAVRKEPSILATNDRKIMMVRHKDGSIAFHAFIGATAVNNVDVTVHPGSVNVGDDFGSMGYGTRNKGEWIRAKNEKMIEISPESAVRWHWKMILSVLKFLNRISSSLSRGIHIQKKSPEANFDAGGSTVISIYLKRDYVPTPEIVRFTEVGLRDVPQKEPETLEIVCRLGDILATPVSYQTLKLIESNGILIHPEKPLLVLIEFHKKLIEKTVLSSLEHKWKEILDLAFQGIDDKSSIEEVVSKVSGDNSYILNKFIKAICSPLDSKI